MISPPKVGVNQQNNVAKLTSSSELCAIHNYTQFHRDSFRFTKL